MKLDRHSSIPLYFQLKEYILKKIETGEYSGGSKIPSELDFCNDLDLSRPTVRQAVAELVSEGKLQIIICKGIFVSALESLKEIIDFSSTTFSFFSAKEVNKSELSDLGLIREISASLSEDFADSSILRDGVIFVRRILNENGIPYAYVESLIPAVLYPSLITDIKAGKSIIDITANKYAYLPVKGKCGISVVPADTSVSRALDVARGTPVISTDAKLVSRSGAVCEIVNAFLRSDVCRLSI
ncbi:MAG: GntR family transcriptional regulator [Eubacteriales bacterium]|nr:GntR family transcriptional regulator [Eubacteriales bacterium]